MMASLPAVTDSQASGGARKNNNTTAVAANAALRPPEQTLNCPRCDSPNTKFCYYNNYSLTQPRHFCKTCRRYWTKGGALRNVPVGGGCRKNKKSKSSGSSSSSSTSSRVLDPFDAFTGIADVNGGGLKFFPGLSRAPAMDFQLGVLPFTRLQSPAASGVLGGGTASQFIAFGDFSSSAAASSSTTSMVGLSYPIQPGVYGEMGGASPAVNCSTNGHNSLALSIESLSSINQDLHWKLQQQRLAMMFGGGVSREGGVSALSEAPLLDAQQHQQQQEEEEPISFQMITDSSKAEVCGGGGITKGCGGRDGDTTAAWFFEGSYTMPTANNSNNISSTSGNNTSNWNGVSGWNDLQHQFTALP